MFFFQEGFTYRNFLTNVVTIASGVGFPYFSIQFGGLGIEMQKHGIGHALYLKDDKTGWELSEKIRAFHFSLIARFMQKLQSIPEGGGTMLDNTVVVYLSDGAETHHSRCFEWPMVVLGNVRQKLNTAGRYIVLPDYGKPGHQTINTLYNSLLSIPSSAVVNTTVENLSVRTARRQRFLVQVTCDTPRESSSDWSSACSESRRSATRSASAASDGTRWCRRWQPGPVPRRE